MHQQVIWGAWAILPIAAKRYKSGKDGKGKNDDSDHPRAVGVLIRHTALYPESYSGTDSYSSSSSGRSEHWITEELQTLLDAWVPPPQSDLIMDLWILYLMNYDPLLSLLSFWNQLLYGFHMSPLVLKWCFCYKIFKLIKYICFQTWSWPFLQGAPIAFNWKWYLLCLFSLIQTI